MGSITPKNEGNVGSHGTSYFVTFTPGAGVSRRGLWCLWQRPRGADLSDEATKGFWLKKKRQQVLGCSMGPLQISSFFLWVLKGWKSFEKNVFQKKTIQGELQTHTHSWSWYIYLLLP